jgi:hypothetical protein
MELAQTFSRTTISSSTGAGTRVLKAGTAGLVNRLHALVLTSTGGTFHLEGSTGSSTGAGYTALSGKLTTASGVPLTIPFDPRKEGALTCVSGSALNLVSTGIGVAGYAIVSQSDH